MLALIILLITDTHVVQKPKLNVEFLDWSAPNLELTPGQINYEVSQDNLQYTICNPLYIRHIHHATNTMKTEVIKRYISKYKFWPICQPLGPDNCQIDYLVPLELGGANTTANLWPQFYCNIGDGPNHFCYGAREKDLLEAFLVNQVCMGRMKLVDAQMMIAKDWLSTYLELRRYH